MIQRNETRNPCPCLEKDLEDGIAQARLIANHVRRRLPSHADCDDLLADGLVGLVEAAGRYDPQRGVSFRTFAEPRIRGAILDGLRTLDPLPRGLRQQQRAAEQAVDTLTAQLRRHPTEEEVARHMQLPLPRWRKLAQHLWYAGAPGNGDGRCIPPPPPIEQISARVGDPEQQAARAELRRLLAQAIETLPARQQTVIRLRYGGDQTMKEIGALLGVGESRASQLHTEVLRRLRQHLERLLLRG